MENKEPKIDYKKLSPEQRDKLELYTMNVEKKRKLEDIATLVQEIIYMLDENEDSAKEAIKSLGALFVDVRESIKQLVEKENPQYDDKKVVEALQKLDNNVVSSLQKLDIAPQVHVEAPQVEVAAPIVDLSGIRESISSGYAEVAKAIKAMPKVELPEYPDRWDEVLASLQSIDTASRLKPEFPTQIKVVNPDGSTIAGGSGSLATLADFSVNDIEDAATAYFGKTKPDGTWLIQKVTDTLVSYATVTNNATVTSYTDAWADRATLTYGRFDQAF